MNNELRSLKAYTKDAKKIISHKLGYSKRWLTDENITSVVYQLVYADQHYDPTKGSLNNWRYHSAMIAIRRMVATKKRGPISLSHILITKASTDYNLEGCGCPLELGDIIEDKKQRIKEEPDFDIKDLVDHECLTKLESFYLKEYYVAGKKQVQIAEERGVTNRAVSFGIIQAVEKLKVAFNVENK